MSDIEMRNTFLEKAIEDILGISDSKGFYVNMCSFLSDIRVKARDSEVYLKGRGFEVPGEGSLGLFIEREHLIEFIRKDLPRNLEREPLLRYPGSELVVKVIFPPCGLEVRRVVWFKECRFSSLVGQEGYFEIGRVAFSSRWIVFFAKNEIGIVYLREPDPLVFNLVSNFLLRVTTFRGFIRTISP